MSGIEHILQRRRIFHNLTVIVAGLFKFACKERAPCYGAPCLVTFRIEVFNLEIALKRLAEVFKLKVAVTDTDCNRKIVRTQCFVSLIVTQCLFRLLQGSVTAGNPPDNPFTVAIQQIGMQVASRAPCTSSFICLQ